MVGVLTHFAIGVLFLMKKIFSETIHDEFISNNILQKSLAIAQSPNIAIGQAALSCLDYFLTYGEFFLIL
jgi:hypothetical protein